MTYRLVKDYVSRDLVICLEQLLAAAQNGTVRGIAFGAILSQQRYITNVAGACHKNPTFTLGVVRVLDHELHELVLGRDANETR